MSARAWVVLVALAACLLGALLDWDVFLRSWLTATILWAPLPLGAVAVLLTYGLTGGAWGENTHGLWRAMAATMPLLALAMLPLMFGIETLFSWTAPAESLPEVVQRKLIYLNEPFLVIRTLLYLVIWLSLSFCVGAFGGRARRFNALGLILLVLSITFFGFDWLMSLEPRFYSDVYGLMLITGSAASAMAFGMLTIPAGLEPQIRADLANLWLAVLLGWALMAFSQLIIIWSGNLPHEIQWYTNRQTGYWPWVEGVAFCLYLGLPFAVLLSTAAKRSAGWMRVSAAVCLIGHLLYVHWLVLPAFETSRVNQYWLDPAAVITLSAAFLWLFARRMPRREASHG